MNRIAQHIDEAADVRPKLLAVAYRMLGSVADAEDAVQDAYVRYQEAGRQEHISSPDAWLVKTTTRLCIDRLRQAKRREAYHGPWLPEPVPNAWEGAAADRMELAESLSMAFLVLLETLSPAERAAYLLREAFGYEFDEIAELLDKSPVNVRQITARVRKRLDASERRYEASAEQATEMAERFFAACRAGDRETIESMLADDVTSFADGGGVVHASPRPVRGVHLVAKLMATVFHKLLGAAEFSLTTVNGQPGAVFYADGRPIVTYSFAADGGKIREIYSVINPEKLAPWKALSPKHGEN